MPRGSKPGERRGGRQKGSLNKATIRRLEAEAAETRQKATNGPSASQPVPAPQAASPSFRALTQLRTIATQFLGLAAQEQRKLQSPDPATQATGNRQLFLELLERAARVLKDIAPYEDAKLSSITLQQIPFDLTRLSDAELELWETLAAKAAISPGDTSGTGPSRH